MLHRTLPTAAVLTGLDQARSLGVFNADTVAVNARRAITEAASTGTVPVPVPAGAPPGALVHRPAPSLAGYDQLLTPATRKDQPA